ncbi:unnamed protein product [Caenorhabditis nigoni]
MKKISEFLKSNDHYLKSCILYEVALKKPIFDSYRNFCDTVGHDVMEYQDFEFWYHRFSLGEVDFDYDRSMDPAMSKTLMDMPIKLMRKITEEMDPFERRYLRSINHAIKNFNDSLPTVFKSIRINAYKNELDWELNGNEYKCKKEGDGCTFSKPKCLNAEKSEKGCYRCERDDKVTETYEESYMKKGLEYLTPLFKIPNLQINEFRFSMMDQSPELNDLLPGPFYAKEAFLFAYNFDKMVQILKNMKAGHLETLIMEFMDIGREHFGRIFETDQFKQAKSVRVLRAKLSLEGDLVNFSHLKHFTCYLSPIEPEEILRIREIVSTFKNLESCSIRYVRDGRPIGPLAVVLHEDVPEGPVEGFTHRYKNPAFNKTLEFNIQERGDYCFFDIHKV